MKHLKLIPIISLILLLSSCNDYLSVNKYFDDSFKFDSIFANKVNLERYLWGTAALFPDEGAIWGNGSTPGVTATDEAFTLNGTDEYRGMAFILGEVNPDNLKGMGNWGQMYQIIRKVNILISNIDKCKNLTALDKNEILGYAYFMRAYAYYNILMSYGPVVMIGDKIYETNEKSEYYNTSRATYDESVDYICSEMEKAAKYMPSEVTYSQFGRPTSGAAYALVARLRLQAASPSFNGGTIARTVFGNWTRKSDGKHYISQVYDEQKWAVAAFAAKRVIDLKKYSLYTTKKQIDTPVLPSNVPAADFPNGAGNIDPYHSYADMFNGEALSNRNPEYIWARPDNGNVRYYTKASFPRDLGGWNGMAVPQKIIDAYYMRDGQTIDNSSSIYPYSETGSTSKLTSFSGYSLRSGTSNMYANREMRFYASIGFSGCFWPCTSTGETGKYNVTVTYYKGGNAGKYSNLNNPIDYPATGYVSKKYIHPDDAWMGQGGIVLDKSFPIIRYAEILLSYVEALNNLTGSRTVMDESGKTNTFTRDENEMAYYFNQIRYRVALPGLKSNQLADKSEMSKVIERERMIEFFHENRRYYDLRRWGNYIDVAKEPISGMNVEVAKPDFYNRVIIQEAKARNRIADPKLIFLPISRSEIRKVPLLDQNPGWDN